uniref:Uncharacterized protein n=1 Tax=Rhizophora mucronata TaxID=61149 RepID=A0A2P2N3B2_RHIMU
MTRPKHSSLQFNLSQVSFSHQKNSISYMLSQ